MTIKSIPLAPKTLLRLLKYLGYPPEWSEHGLLPDEIAHLQLREVLDRLGVDEAAFAELPDELSYGGGNEHFRSATILYWLQRPRSSVVTSALRDVISKDPDKPMSLAFLRNLDNKVGR